MSTYLWLVDDIMHSDVFYILLGLSNEYAMYILCTFSHSHMSYLSNTYFMVPAINGTKNFMTANVLLFSIILNVF